MSDGNPFAKENNPFSGGGDSNVPQGAPAGFPSAPPAMAETTKPRQMPGGSGGDTNVPQPGGAQTTPPESSVPAKAAYIRAINPHLTEAQVQRLARKVVAEFDNNPLDFKPHEFPKREVNFPGGRQRNSTMGDLNDPYNPWSPLNYDHPNYKQHAGKQPWEIGDFNDPRNPHSPLNPNHALNQHYVRSGIQFGRRKKPQPAGDPNMQPPVTASLVEFYKQAEYANDPLDYQAKDAQQPVTPATNKEHGLPTHIPGAVNMLNKVMPGGGAAAGGAAEVAEIAPLLLL